MDESCSTSEENVAQTIFIADRKRTSVYYASEWISAEINIQKELDPPWAMERTGEKSVQTGRRLRTKYGQRD